jgi:hypothetical protein
MGKEEWRGKAGGIILKLLMNNDMTLTDVMRYLKRIDEKLTTLLNREQGKTKTWVKVSIVQELTGWDNERLKKARANGLINFRKDKAKRIFEYDINSIHPLFIKKAQ